MSVECVVGCVALTVALVMLVYDLYWLLRYRRDCNLWQEECTRAEEACETAEANNKELRSVLGLLQKTGMEQLDNQIKAEGEAAYLQNMIANSNNGRNMALEMHAEVRRWRNDHWNNATCQLIRTLFREKDGPRDELVMALRAEFDRETEDLIKRCKQITDWPNVPMRPNPVEEEPCEPSSSPED